MRYVAFKAIDFADWYAYRYFNQMPMSCWEELMFGQIVNVVHGDQQNLRFSSSSTAAIFLVSEEVDVFNNRTTMLSLDTRSDILFGTQSTDHWFTASGVWMGKLPIVFTWIETGRKRWSFSETIHPRFYTCILFVIFDPIHRLFLSSTCNQWAHLVSVPDTLKYWRFTRGVSLENSVRRG